MEKLANRIQKYPIATLAIVLFIAMISIIWPLYYLLPRAVEISAVENVRIYANAIREFRTLYTSEVVNRIADVKGIEITHNYKNKPHAIPLPATLSILLGKRIGIKKGGWGARLYSPYPFLGRLQTGGLKDPFSREAWEYLALNKHKTFSRYEMLDGIRTLRFATADLMRESCVSCHNTHPDSSRRDWKVGDVRGVLEITQPMHTISPAIQNLVNQTLLIAFFATSLVLLILGTIIYQSRRLNLALARKTSQLELTVQELESFSYSVSHDLKTPLQGISGFSKILLDTHSEQLDQKGKSHLQRIAASAGRMSGLVDTLLNLSELSRYNCKIEPVDISQMALETLGRLREQNIERKIETKVTPGLMVNGDRHLLGILLDNLLGNAWKYTGKSTNPVIEFGLTNINAQAVFYVRDNGAGFDMKYKKKLFLAFKRLHTSKEFMGNGIGLATVERIIARHGGKVWAESETGKGATFFFTLSPVESIPA